MDAADAVGRERPDIDVESGDGPGAHAASPAGEAGGRGRADVDAEGGTGEREALGDRGRVVVDGRRAGDGGDGGVGDAAPVEAGGPDSAGAEDGSDATTRRARLAVAAVFFVNGALFANWVARVPAVKDDIDAGPGALGVALLGLAAGSLLTMPWAGRLCERVGSHTAILVSGVVASLALAGPALAVDALTLGLVLAAYGAAFGLLDVAMNVQAVAVVRRVGRPIMPWFHAAFSVGGLAGAGTGALAAGVDLSPLTHFLLAGAASVVIVLAAGRHLLPDVVARDPAAPTSPAPAAPGALPATEPGTPTGNQAPPAGALGPASGAETGGVVVRQPAGTDGEPASDVRTATAGTQAGTGVMTEPGAAHRPEADAGGVDDELALRPAAPDVPAAGEESLQGVGCRMDDGLELRLRTRDVSTPRDASAGPRRPGHRGRRSERLLLVGLGGIAACAALGEGAMADWTALFLRDVTGTSAGVAALGFAAFSITMTAGRLGGEAAIRRLGAVRVLRLGGASATIGILLAVVTASPLPGLVGFGLVGLGFSCAFPLALTTAGESSDGSGGSEIATVSVLGYLGFLVGPPLIGLLAEVVELRVALLAVAGPTLGLTVLAHIVGRAPATRATSSAR